MKFRDTHVVCADWLFVSEEDYHCPDMQPEPIGH